MTISARGRAPRIGHGRKPAPEPRLPRPSELARQAERALARLKKKQGDRGAPPTDLAAALRDAATIAVASGVEPDTIARWFRDALDQAHADGWDG